MAALTQEEEFFLRMLKLVNGVASKAVREKFNNYFPPSSLESILKREKKKLDYYHGLGWINKVQMAKLFPSSGKTVSSNYDVTLMICLIRNFAPIPLPTNGFDKLPPTTEQHDGSDLARVKYYRNCLAHAENDSLTTAEFTMMWDDLYEAILRLGGKNYKSECDHLINLNFNNECVLNLIQELQELRHEMELKLTTTADKMTKEITRVNEIAETCSCHDFHEIEIEEWVGKDQKFVTSDAFDSVLEYVKEKKRITVTGIPGVGKSALIQHIALSLRDQEGYDIIPCSNPSEIQNHFKKNRLQVFVVNDVCGRYILKQYELDEWKKHTSAITNLLEQGSTILVSSCRSQIFKEHNFKSLKLFSSHFCDLSSNEYKLSLDKKIEIAEQYLLPGTVESLKDELNNCPMVPLLCSLYKSDSKTNVSLFFQNPVLVYNLELESLADEWNKTKLCSLFLCVVFNGCISLDAFRSMSRQTLEEIYEVFAVNRGTCTSTVIEQLDSVCGMYITMSEGEYKMIHDKLFDILCSYFGKHHQTGFIKFAHSKAIYERTCLGYDKVEKIPDVDDLSVYIECCNECDYFDRILDDIRHGNVIEVFYSKQMENKEFRAKMTSFILTKDKLEIKTLLYKRENIQQGGVDTPFHMVCALGYDDLLKVFLQFSDSANLFASDEFPPLQQACYYGSIDVVRLFISNGADLNSSGFNGLTPLIWACLGEHLEIVNMLLLNKANVNLSVSGRSAIFEACSIQNSEILDTLIKYGANIKATDGNGETPITRSAQNGLDRHVSILLSHYTDSQEQTIMLEACRKDCLPLVKFLIQKKLNHADVNGMTGLTYACEYGHLAIVKTLMEAGCHFEQFVSGEVFPLLAACRGRQREIIEYLIEKNVNVNSSTNSGWTALMETCEIGDIDLMNLLLEKGASINQQDESGKSPLMLVSETGDRNAVQLLIKNGADVNQIDEHGSSAFILACDNKHTEVIRILSDTVAISQLFDYADGEMVLYRWLEPEYKKVVELLFELPLDFNVKNYHGHTLLGEAIRKRKDYAIKFLLDKGVNIDLKNKIGQSPVLVACMHKQYQLLPYLVDKGATISLSDNLGNSVLHTLCLNDKFSQDYNMSRESDLYSNSSLLDISTGICTQKLAIKYCLDKGVEINAKNGKGQTPLFIACKHLDIGLVYFLITNGADVTMTDTDGGSVVHKLYAGQVFISQTFQEDRAKRITIARTLLDNGLKETFYVEINNKLVQMLITKDVEAIQLLPSLDAINIYLSNLRITNQPTLISDLFLDDAIKTCGNKMFGLDALPLCEMIRQKYTALALYLIENGADINETERPTGLTPLIISLKMDSVVAESLIKRGVDLNTTDGEGRTPLQWATLYNYYSIVQLLLAGGANVNARSSNGRTAFMLAFAIGENLLTDSLIEKGADISLKDHNGMNAIFFSLFYLFKNMHKSYVHRLGNDSIEEEIYFFDDLRSANEVIVGLMRTGRNPFKHRLPIPIVYIQDISSAVTVFLKEGGWTGIAQLKNAYHYGVGYQLNCLFRLEFSCKKDGCSKHILLDYLYSKENMDRESLPCTLDEVKKFLEELHT